MLDSAAWLRLTFLLFSADGLTMVSSGRLGLGLGDSQELKKDWMNGSRFCPFWETHCFFYHQCPLKAQSQNC